MKSQIALLFLFIIILVFITIFFLFFWKQTSPTGVFKCECEIPEYGKREILITVQIKGEEWAAKSLYPTNITLNILGYSVPCVCKSY